MDGSKCHTIHYIVWYGNPAVCYGYGKHYPRTLTRTGVRGTIEKVLMSCKLLLKEESIDYIDCFKQFKVVSVVC